MKKINFLNWVSFFFPLSCLVFLLLVSCAGKRHRDETVFRNQKPEDDSLAYTREAYQNQYGDFAGMSVYALVRALVDPAWLKNSFVGGRCSVSDSQINLALPCPPTPVVLRTGNGAEISRTTTDGGKFQFKGNPGDQYWLTVEPLSTKLAAEKVGPFKVGEDVELTLKKNRARRK